VLGLVLRGESVHAIALVGSLVAVSGAYLVNSTRGPVPRPRDTVAR
jgi:hypothetical protein